MELENIKSVVENMSKHHQIEILKIIKYGSSNKINENKSGCYINLSFLPSHTMDEINKYIEYVLKQEQILTPFESEKDVVKNTFFIEKGDKDELTSIYNYQG